MAATIYRLGEDIVKSYAQRVQGGKITIQEAMLKGAQASNKYIRDLIWRNISMGEYTVPYGCLFEYTVGVEKDTTKGKWFATLPIRTLESLHNNMGIYYVAAATDIYTPIIPLATNFNALYRGLDAFGLETQLGYTPERDRIYIQGVDVDENFKVFMRLIPDSTTLNPDDPMPIPPDCEYEVIQMALQLLAPQIQTPEILK